MTDEEAIDRAGVERIEQLPRSDWTDQDLLTKDEARERLADSAWRLAQQPPGPGPASVPLSNEPAVRAVLYRAFDRAALLPGASITPAVLLDAVHDVHLQSRRVTTCEPPRPTTSR